MYARQKDGDSPPQHLLRPPAHSSPRPPGFVRPPRSARRLLPLTAWAQTPFESRPCPADTSVSGSMFSGSRFMTGKQGRGGAAHRRRAGLHTPLSPIPASQWGMPACKYSCHTRRPWHGRQRPAGRNPSPPYHPHRFAPAALTHPHNKTTTRLLKLLPERLHELRSLACHLVLPLQGSGGVQGWPATARAQLPAHCQPPQGLQPRRSWQPAHRPGGRR